MKYRKKLEVETRNDHTGVGFLDDGGYRTVDKYEAHVGGLGVHASWYHEETIIVKIDIEAKKATVKKTREAEKYMGSHHEEEPHKESKEIEVDYKYARKCYTTLQKLFSTESTEIANKKFKDRIEMLTNYNIPKLKELEHKGAPIIIEA